MWYNDIALLRLDPGISEWTNFMHPICMPSQYSPYIADETVVVSGMGINVQGMR